jgi:hypothetical protein
VPKLKRVSFLEHNEEEGMPIPNTHRESISILKMGVSY